MGLTETLRLIVTDDGSLGKLANEAQKTAAVTEKGFTKSKSAADKWAGGLTKAGAGMMAFGGAALFGLGKMAEASEEADKSTLKLQNSLRANPRLAGENVKTYTDLATAIQGKTAADADDITAGIAVLAQGKLNAAQMKELIPLVVDLARKKGMDETAAFQLASKAAGGNALALKKQGIAVDENLAKTDAFKATVEALKHSVGGYAEAEGKTFSGSLERLKNQLGDLEEGVGKGAVEAFTSMFKVVGDGAMKLESISPGMQATIGKVATFSAVAITAAGGLSFLIGQVIQARQRFGDLASAIARNSSTLGRMGSFAANVALNFGVLYEATHLLDNLLKEAPADANKLENALLRLGNTGKVSGELAGKFGKNLGDLKDAVNAVIKPSLGRQVEHVSESLSHLGGLFGSTGLDKQKDRIDQLDKSLAKLAERSPQAAARALDQLIDRLNLGPKQADRFKKSLNDYQSTLAGLDTGKATDGVDKLGGAMGDSGDKTGAATEKLKSYSDQLQAMTDPIFAVQSALLQETDAQAKLTEAVGAETQARAAHEKAVARSGASSKAARDAAAKEAEAHRAVQQATLDASRASIDLAGSEDELAKKLASGEIKASQAQKQIYRLAVAQGASRDNAWRQAAAIGATTAQINRMAHTPNPRKSIILSPTPAHIREQLDSVTNALNRIPRSIPIHVQVFTSGFADLQAVAHAGPIRAHAAGGDIGPGEAGIVGEKGWELAVGKPGGGAHIYNQAQLRTMAAPSGGRMAGGAGTASVTINLNGGDDDFMRWLRRRIKADGGGDVQRALGQR